MSSSNGYLVGFSTCRSFSIGKWNCSHATKKPLGKNPDLLVVFAVIVKKYLLPDEILWRNKCAFSDGVSNQKNSWHTIIKSFFDKKISNNEFENSANKYKHCPPNSKESYYYRKIFDKALIRVTVSIHCSSFEMKISSPIFLNTIIAINPKIK